jgi:vacuolar-type H+-ATPase subunit F/Vma7
VRRLAASGRHLCIVSDATSFPGFALVGIAVGDQSCVVSIKAKDYDARKIFDIINEQHPT